MDEEEAVDIKPQVEENCRPHCSKVMFDLIPKFADL